MKKLVFLHTSPVHVATFERLLHESGSPVEARHLVHAELLDEARQSGITDTLQKRVDAIIDAAATADDFVLCTCSTIGGCAEAANGLHKGNVMRVDRAMARRAIELGPQIVVCAALSSTLTPTLTLLEEEAQAANKTIEQTPLLCTQAWPLFEAGDLDGYHQCIAKCLRNHLATNRAPDVVVLAQASMAGATVHCTDLSVPILSSPQLGIEAALAALNMQA